MEEERRIKMKEGGMDSCRGNEAVEEVEMEGEGGKNDEAK